jgi:hypothetical protein
VAPSLRRIMVIVIIIRFKWKSILTARDIELPQLNIVEENGNSNATTRKDSVGSGSAESGDKKNSTGKVPVVEEDKKGKTPGSGKGGRANSAKGAPEKSAAGSRGTSAAVDPKAKLGKESCYGSIVRPC